MPLPLNPALAATFNPPVMEARRWLAETTLPPGLPLLNLSQAAPVDPPPAPMRAAMARAIEDDPSVHLYNAVLGNPELRAALAERSAAHYGAPVAAEQVAITSGCNQAFCAAIATLAAGTATAWLVTAHDFPGRRFFEWALILPLAVPAYIAAYTYAGMFDVTGPLQRFVRATVPSLADEFLYLDVMGIGMVTLMRHLTAWGFELADGKASTPYLVSMGFWQISRDDFVEVLLEHRDTPAPGPWAVDDTLDCANDWEPSAPVDPYRPHRAA